MKLRMKTFIIIGAIAFSILSTLYVYSQSVLLNSFVKLEEQSIMKNVDQALSGISMELFELNSKTGDWAEWDDTYVFMQDLNQNYIKTNIVDGSFINLRINLLLYINSSGQTVFASAFDLQNRSEIPVPKSVEEAISTSHLFWRYSDINNETNGIIFLPEDPLLFASRPILTSEREGPIQGTLIMAPYLNSEEIDYLENATRLPLVLNLFSDTQLPADFVTARSYLSDRQPIYVQPLNANYVGGYAMIRDVSGTPSLILRVDVPRDVYKQGLNTINYFVLSLFGISISFGAVTILLLEIVVLSRLTLLTNFVTSIGKTRNIESKIPMSGNDELSILAKSINNMLVEINDKTVRLNKSERFAAIGELSTMIAHDLRNPLQGIANATYYLKKKVGLRMDDKTNEMLQFIEKDVKYSSKIVNDLLDYSRQIKLELTKTTPKSITSAALSKFENLPSIKILNLTQNEPEIEVDEEQMKRVFVNIITNAVDAMPEGGTLAISSKRIGDNVEFKFSDTGIGIPQETLEKLFSPLFTTKARGMGFGLAICKRIVESHRGRISAESTVGKGTTFIVTIPLNAVAEGGENA